jgi:hypothetical protein
MVTDPGNMPAFGAAGGILFVCLMAVVYLAFIISWFMLVYAVWQIMRSVREMVGRIQGAENPYAQHPPQ